MFSEELPVPDEILHLLEKRIMEDRRKKERRSPQNSADAPAVDFERRAGEDRRSEGRRVKD